MPTPSMKVARHTLATSNPKSSLAFYQGTMGMRLVSIDRAEGNTRWLLGFVNAHGDDVAQSHAGLLELIYKPGASPPDIVKQPSKSEGYWKIAISVADLDVAHRRLIELGSAPDEPRQVGDIAYLCHLDDPDGYCVELIQHEFKQNHTPEPENPDHWLLTPASFLLITYRVKDPELSLNFYTKILGMRLLSKQVITTRGVTHYFLAFTNDQLPHADVEHVGNREWLWQRSYTVIELQHIWGTEADESFVYRSGPESGFVGVTIASDDLAAFQQTMREKNIQLDIDDSIQGCVCLRDGRLYHHCYRSKFYELKL